MPKLDADFSSYASSCLCGKRSFPAKTRRKVRMRRAGYLSVSPNEPHVQVPFLHVSSFPLTRLCGKPLLRFIAYLLDAAEQFSEFFFGRSVVSAFDALEGFIGAVPPSEVHGFHEGKFQPVLRSVLFIEPRQQA